MASTQQSIQEAVTAKIIAAIESGEPGQWTCPWDRSGGGWSFPLRANGQPYNGVNVLILWGAAKAKGYRARHWFTFNQAKELGAYVRKGEKAEQIVYVGTAADKKAEPVEGEKEKRFSFLKTYYVFNAEQIDGLPEEYYAKPAPLKPRAWADVADLDAFAKATRITIIEGGTMAAYSPQLDAVKMPDRQRFPAADVYYSTLFHELTHATGASHRVGRELSTRFGDKAYAAEELIAELGAAFLCAALGVTKEPRADHASYLKHWLDVLKADSKAIFTAASAAQKAADWLMAQSGAKAEPVAETVQEAA